MNLTEKIETSITPPSNNSLKMLKLTFFLLKAQQLVLEVVQELHQVTLKFKIFYVIFIIFISLNQEQQLATQRLEKNQVGLSNFPLKSSSNPIKRKTAISSFRFQNTTVTAWLEKFSFNQYFEFTFDLLIFCLHRKINASYLRETIQNIINLIITYKVHFLK